MYSTTLGRWISRNTYRQLIGPKYSVDLSNPLSIQLLNNFQILVVGNYVDGYSGYIATFAMRQGLDPSGEPWGLEDLLNLLKDPDFWKKKPVSVILQNHQMINSGSEAEGLIPKWGCIGSG